MSDELFPVTPYECSRYLTDEERRLATLRKIDAIKALRERTGLGLYEAKKIVEGHIEHVRCPEAVKPRSRYVLYSESLGVYLGGCMGLGFFSRLDPVGQDAAVTFPSAEEAVLHSMGWSTPVSDIRAMPVVAGDDGYATIAQCEAAGLPTWDPEGTELDGGGR